MGVRGSSKAEAGRGHGPLGSPLVALAVLLLLPTLLAWSTPAHAASPLPDAATLNHGLEIYLTQCSGCHRSIGPTVRELVAFGIAREPLERAWQTTGKRGPLPDWWSPYHDFASPLRHASQRQSLRRRGMMTWQKNSLPAFERTIEAGHPLPDKAAWPRGDDLVALRAMLRQANVEVSEVRALLRWFAAAGLLLVAATLAAAGASPRALLQLVRSGPGLAGVLLATLAIALFHVQLRPAPFDVLALLIAAFALVSGAIPRRAWLGFGLWCAWVAASGVALVEAIPRPEDPTFWSYLAAELELPLLAIALVGLRRRGVLSAGGLRTTLAIGVLLESAMLCGMLASGNESPVFNLHPSLSRLPRIVGAFRDPNIFGGTHAVVFGVLLDGILRRHTTAARGVAPAGTDSGAAVVAMRLEMGAALLAVVWAFASGSRAAQVGLVGASVVHAIALVRAPTASRRFRVVGQALGVATFAALVVWLAAADLNAVFRRADFGRIELLRRGLQSIDPVSMLFGHGLLSAERAAGWIAPHSSVVRLFSEHGLLRWVLLAWTLHRTAGGTLRGGRLVGVGAGLLVPLVLVDVAHWRVLALLPCLALDPAPADGRPFPAAWPDRRALVQNLLPPVIAGALALAAAAPILAADVLKTDQRIEVLAGRCGEPQISTRGWAGILPDFRNHQRWAEVFEDALRRADPPIPFMRTDGHGRKFAHGRIFRFELPLPDRPEALAATHALGCVLTRWRDPGPCPRPESDEAAFEAARTALRRGKVCVWREQVLPGDTLPRRRAAGLLGVFVFGLALAAAHGGRRTRRTDNASS